VIGSIFLKETKGTLIWDEYTSASPKS